MTELLRDTPDAKKGAKSHENSGELTFRAPEVPKDLSPLFEGRQPKTTEYLGKSYITFTTLSGLEVSIIGTKPSEKDNNTIAVHLRILNPKNNGSLTQFGDFSKSTNILTLSDQGITFLERQFLGEVVTGKKYTKNDFQ